MAKRMWTLWHGGPSYAAPCMDEVEVYESQEEAASVLASREANVDGSTPAVVDSSMLVWFSDPRGQDDPYPDCMLSLVDGEPVMYAV